MGVKFLWDIIDDARTIETLDCLRGKTIAIDLSIWIVEAIKTLQFKSGILKPHLRNIFFRVLFLRRLGVKLIFVTEGEAPDLKQETMKKRAFAQYGVKTKTKGKVGRSRFQRTIDECTRMFDLIGIPHVRAQGEAEEMCAVLNKHGLVDGCLTNDGDFFLYGGETIYRDFGINPKDQHVLVYTMKMIKERTGINRHDMIALALLNGCDYTEGIPGVGKKTVKKFLEDRDFSEDLLIRFQKWNDDDFVSAHVCSCAELTILRKIKGNMKFPNDKIIDEFLVQKDRLDNLRGKMKWTYPSIKELQAYLLKHLEWPEEYTLPKILQIATSTYLEKLSDDTFFPVPIEPIRIVKTKCQMGVCLVDLDWQKYSDNNTTYGSKWENCPESFVTLENQQVVSKVLPNLVAQYNEMKESKKKGTTKKKTTQTEEEEKKKSSQPSDKIVQRNTCTEKEFTIKDQCQDVIKSKISCNIDKDCTSTSDENTGSEDEEDIVLLPSLTERLAKMKLVESRSSSSTKVSTKRKKENENVFLCEKSINKQFIEEKPKVVERTSAKQNDYYDDGEESNNKRYCEPSDKDVIQRTFDERAVDIDVNRERSNSKIKARVDNKENCTNVVPKESIHKEIEEKTRFVTQLCREKHIKEVDSRDDCVEKRTARETFNSLKTSSQITSLNSDMHLNSTPSHQIEPRVIPDAGGISFCLKKALSSVDNITPVSSDQNKMESFFSPSSDDFMVEAMERFEEKKSHENICLQAGLLKETPLCLNMCTPVSSRNDKSSHLKDITNFSNLGDSILIGDDDGENGGDVKSTPKQSNCCHRDENDYEQALRRKLNLTMKNGEVEEINEASFAEDLLPRVDETTDSPLCLADRLKIKMRSKK